jgi:short-subunit dehydrogenase
MPISDMEISKARNLFDLNVWSLIAVTQAFLTLLLASTHEDGALLINHGSLSGVIAASGPFAGAYNASKAAVTSFTETMRLELEPFNIKVLNLVTGAVRSTFHVNAPRPQLPANSLYAVAWETVERAMDNEDGIRIRVSGHAAWLRRLVGAGRRIGCGRGSSLGL